MDRCIERYRVALAQRALVLDGGIGSWARGAAAAAAAGPSLLQREGYAEAECLLIVKPRVLAAAAAAAAPATIAADAAAAAATAAAAADPAPPYLLQRESYAKAECLVIVVWVQRPRVLHTAEAVAAAPSTVAADAAAAAATAAAAGGPAIPSSLEKERFAAAVSLGIRLVCAFRPRVVHPLLAFLCAADLPTALLLQLLDQRVDSI